MDRERAQKLVKDALYKYHHNEQQAAAISAFERVFDVDASEACPLASKQEDVAYEESREATEKLIVLLCGEARSKEKTPFELITDAAKELGLEVSGYTPRGMDRKVLLSVSCPNMSTIISLGQHIGNPGVLPTAQADSLGGHYVVYWPRIEFPNTREKEAHREDDQP